MDENPYKSPAVDSQPPKRGNHAVSKVGEAVLWIALAVMLAAILVSALSAFRLSLL